MSEHEKQDGQDGEARMICRMINPVYLAAYPVNPVFLVQEVFKKIKT